jgi:hypothetical protein
VGKVTVQEPIAGLIPRRHIERYLKTVKHLIPVPYSKAKEARNGQLL